MRAATLLAGLLTSALIATPSLAAKSKIVNRNAPTWAQCYQISLDRGMDHEYEEWREFLQDCMAGKIPLVADKVTPNGKFAR
jgi:hypothetical protein